MYNRRFQRSSNSGLRTTFHAIIRELNKLISCHMENSINSQWSNFLSKLHVGGKNFFKIAKRIKGKSSFIKTFTVNNREITDNAEKAELVANHFANAHLTTLNSCSLMDEAVNSVVGVVH